MINNLNFYPKNNIFGDIIQLKTTSPLHNDGLKKEITPESSSANFANAISTAVGKVNEQQLYSENLSQQAIANPASVQVHDLKIALEKSKMSLTFTKKVTELTLRAYKELVNLR